MGVLGLFQHDDFIQLWRVSRLDWMIWVITFLFTLFLGVEIGLLAGVVVSLVLVLYKTAFPRIASLGRLPGTRVYRNKDMYADVIEPPGMILVRIDAPIYFANVEGIKDFLLDKLEKGQQEHQQLGDPVRFVIIDLSPSPNIDIAGVHFFEDLVAELTRDNIQLILANPSRDVMLKLNRAKLLQKMGDAGVAVSMGEAVAYAETRLMEEASAASSANL